eukprot:4319662-Prymnesium_polylepis.1
MAEPAPEVPLQPSSKSLVVTVTKSEFLREGKYYLTLKEGTNGEEARTDVNEENSRMPQCKQRPHSFPVAADAEASQLTVRIGATQLMFSKGAKEIGSGTLTLSSLPRLPVVGGKPVTSKLELKAEVRGPAAPGPPVATLSLSVKLVDQAAAERERLAAAEKAAEEVAGQEEADEAARREAEEAAARREAEERVREAAEAEVARLAKEAAARKEAEAAAQREAQERARAEAEERSRLNRERARREAEEAEKARLEAEE